MSSSAWSRGEWWRERSAAKHRADRLALWAAVILTGHVDVIAPDGRWCVTKILREHLLYERLPDGPTGQSVSLVIYDEAWPDG